MPDERWVDDPTHKPYIRSFAQQEREIRAILARDFSARLLNDTKWRELMAWLDGLSLPCRIKFVDAPTPLEGRLFYLNDKCYDSWWGPVPILWLSGWRSQASKRWCEAACWPPKRSATPAKSSAG